MGNPSTSPPTSIPHRLLSILWLLPGVMTSSTLRFVWVEMREVGGGGRRPRPAFLINTYIVSESCPIKHDVDSRKSLEGKLCPLNDLFEILNFCSCKKCFKLLM